MEKPAQHQHEIHDLFRRRWSPRSFDATRNVEPEKLNSCLEAARWAPSCFNEQPWRFIVFTKENKEAMNQAHDCLMEGNRWAKNAPALILSVAKDSFTKNDKHNRHAQHDVGLSVENLVLQGTDLGLVTHQMAGFDAEKAIKYFNIPNGYTPMAMIALGYQAPADELEESFREKELGDRSRKTLREFAFSGSWGKPLG